jgi:nickel/cobalt exporter
VGVVHGLAGSAGVALVALTTLPTRSGALLYLALFGAGVVTGMMLLTAVMAWPLTWAARYAERSHRALLVGASVASVAMGAAVAFEAL